MHITKITISNYLGIAKLSCNKLGKLNMIRGENGAGKTSILKAITEAFKSSGNDINLINNKADDGKAEILIELSDGLLVERLITEKNNRVIVKDGNGEPVNKPQAFLDTLLGPNAFNLNPMEFYQAKGKKRNELLLRAIDFRIKKQSFKAILRKHEIDLELVDFDPDDYDYRKHGIELLDEIKTGVYDFRKTTNVEVVRLKKALELDLRDMPAGDEKDWSAFDVEKATQELIDAGKLMSKIGEAKVECKSLHEKVNSKQQRIVTIESDIRLLQKEKLEIQTKIELAETVIKLKDALIAEAELPEIEDMQAEINSYNSSQDFIFKQKEMAKRQGTLNNVEELHTALEGFYKKLDKEIPKQLLAGSDLPIDGLEFRDDNIFVNYVQVDKLSDSQALVLGIMIARQLAGKLKVICINGFEQLDNNTLAKFEKETADDGFEYFIAEVDRSYTDLQIESTGEVNA